MFTNISPEKAGISSKKVLEFLKVLEEYKFRTHSFIMARGNQIFAEGYYAPFHKDFKHRMYSVSKSFTSVAVGLAIEDGLLTLDDKFISFFPEYINEHTTEQLRNMTIRDMLTMETAHDKEIWWFATGCTDRMEVYFRNEAKRNPGSNFLYDSPGAFMLGVIVEKLTGKPFLEYLKERFLVKIGFSEDAYCLKCPGGYSFSDSGVMCTSEDLLIFARFVMNGGVVDGVRYMNEEYLRDATKKQVSTDNNVRIGDRNSGYGYLIWKSFNDGFVFKGMGDQFAICDPKKDFIFIYNSDNQGYSPTTRPIMWHELYRTIINNLGEPIEEDIKAREELEEYIANQKLFALTDTYKPAFADELNGRTYCLEKNPMGIEYIKFDIQDDKGKLTYKNEQGIKELFFGLGHNEFAKFPEENYSDMICMVPEPGHKYDCAASADWVEEQKLRIYVQIIDKYFGNLTMEFGFKEDKIGVYMYKSAEAFLSNYEGFAAGTWKKEE